MNNTIDHTETVQSTVDDMRVVRSQLQAQAQRLSDTGPVRVAVTDWWQRQPMRTEIEDAVTVAQDALAPSARKHPYLILAAAAAVGAVAALVLPKRVAVLAVPLVTMQAKRMASSLAVSFWRGLGSRRE